MNSRPTGLTPFRISHRQNAWFSHLHCDQPVAAVPRRKIGKRLSEMLISSRWDRSDARLIGWIDVARVVPTRRAPRDVSAALRGQRQAVGPRPHDASPQTAPQRRRLFLGVLVDHVRAMGVAYVEITPVCDDRRDPLRWCFDYGSRSSAWSWFGPAERLLRRMECANQGFASSRSARGRGRLNLVYGTNGEHARAA